ncbi:MAG: hypothetical protein FJY74_08845 [Candidatus Eisenbacteria bacterium]|nr:hypothetical protein [Candidatus Eisenbacteria bacterium]
MTMARALMTDRAALRWRTWIAMLTATLCVSCARYVGAPLPQYDADELVGREVRVTTTDGRVLTFEVVSVSESELVGERLRVPFEEIATLERQEMSPLRTAGAVLGVVAVAAAAGFLVFLVQWITALGGS